MKFLRSRRSRMIAGGIAAIAVVAALSGCSASGGGGDCTVNALFISNLSGAGAMNGQMGAAGIATATEAINAAGGVNGCKVVVDTLDDASTYDDSAVALVKEATATKEYSVVINSDYAGPLIAPYLVQEGILGIFATGADAVVADPTKTPLLFDTVLPSGQVAKALASFVLDQGQSNVAVLVDDQAYGQGVLDQVTNVVESGGGTMAGVERISLDTADFTPAVERLKATGADAVIFNLFGPSVGLFMSALDASGWKPALYGSDAVMATSLEGLVDQSVIESTKMVVAGPAANTTPSVTTPLQVLVDAIAANPPKTVGAIVLAAQPATALANFAWAANGAKSNVATDIAKWLQENGTTPNPGSYYTAAGTGYSATNHMWLPGDSIAIVPAGFLVNGQYTAERLAPLASPSK